MGRGRRTLVVCSAGGGAFMLLQMLSIGKALCRYCFNEPQLGKRIARSALVVCVEAGDALLEQPVHLRQLLSMRLGSCSSNAHRSGVKSSMWQ